MRITRAGPAGGTDRPDDTLSKAGSSMRSVAGKAAAAKTATIDGLDLETVDYALAYNLTVSHVVPGTGTSTDAARAPPASRAILVHNTGSCPVPGSAAKAGAAGADDVLNGVRLRAQLTGQEISGGHAFEKHILELGEFPGIRTRAQFASHIEDVVLNGEARTLGGGRTAFWRDGTVVIRNPRAPDGCTAFQPRDGYDYFLNQLH